VNNELSLARNYLLNDNHNGNIEYMYTKKKTNLPVLLNILFLKKNILRFKN